MKLNESTRYKSQLNLKFEMLSDQLAQGGQGGIGVILRTAILHTVFLIEDGEPSTL